MKLRYAGRCGCGEELPVGSRAAWHSAARTVICESCLSLTPPVTPRSPAPEPLVPVEVDIGRAGASLERQYHQRAAQREVRIRREHPRMGGLILAVTDEPQSTRAFASGAIGERKAADRIVDGCGPDVLFLLNRRLSRERQGGDVDMIAITSDRIHVIDIKRYVDASVEVRRSGGFLSPVSEKLFIGGRDKTKLLESLGRQVEAVRVALADYPAGDSILVRASLCFVDANLPMLRSLQIHDIRILGMRGTTKLLAQSIGTLTADDRRRIQAHLALRMPSAA